MWEAWTNTDSTFLRYPRIFCRIMHTKQICSQESIGALYWYHRLTPHWHCTWHSIDTWLTSRSRIDIFNQCIWVGEHSADYRPNVDRVSVKCHLISTPLCKFCSIVTCDVRCKQHKFSRWALFAFTAIVVKINKKCQLSVDRRLIGMLIACWWIYWLGDNQGHQLTLDHNSFSTHYYMYSCIQLCKISFSI